MDIKRSAPWYGLLFVLSGPVVILSTWVMNGRVGAGDVVFAVVFATVFPILWIWLMRRMGYPLGQATSCPRCGAEMPTFRRPASLKQALWSGSRCPNCGADLDARGRERRADGTP